MNPNYSLIPGTNQLILKHPDQGAQLFRRHGYNIRRPTHRDYYNALRGRNRNSFFNDLGSLLTGLSSVIGKTTAAKQTGFSSKVSTIPGSTLHLMDSPANAGNSVADLSFTGPDRGGHRARAYNELMRHLEMQSRRSAPRYFFPVSPIPYSAGASFALPPANALDWNDGSQDMDIPQESFFEAHKIPIIISAVIIALLVYFKYHK